MSLVFFFFNDTATTEIYTLSLHDALPIYSAAIVLWDANGTPTRATGRGLLQLTVPPGGYDLGLDVDSAGGLGRIRRDVTGQWFSPLRLEPSSLALAPLDRNTPLPDRETTLRGTPAHLSHPPPHPP